MIHIFHSWAKWENVTMHYRGTTWVGVWLEGNQDCQKRICNVCGKKQIGKV